MSYLSSPVTLGGIALFGISIGLGAGLIEQRTASTSSLPTPHEPINDGQINFLVAAGGGHRSYNEIALEKNVFYFQRSLTHLGLNPAAAPIYFANGNDGQATVRYLDDNDQERFKVPEIEGLTGAATWRNVHQAFQNLVEQQKDCPTFFYFTGHGSYNGANPDNNAMILWQERTLSVQELSGWLDELPADQPFVTMMAQCFSGSFTNLIYEQGDPDQPVALHTRCGFFATVANRPSVGCTPAVNEADYKDYSSSFFAGLTGIDRVGNPVSSADYDQDGTISYAEAHAFAKVDEETTDWPISTVEAWLQQQATEADRDRIWQQSLATLIEDAPPQRQYVVMSLAKEKLNLDLHQPYLDQQQWVESDTVEEAYWKRLEMELLNIGMIEKIRASADVQQQTILEKLLTCEGGSWQ